MPLEELLKLYGNSNELEESASAMDTDDEDESEVDNAQKSQGSGLSFRRLHTLVTFQVSFGLM